MRELLDFFREEGGKFSIKRLTIFLLLMVFCIGYVKSTLATNTVIDIPANWLVLFLGVLGIMVSGKVLENKNGSDKN